MGEKDFLNQLGADINLAVSGVGGEIIDFGIANPNKGRGIPLEVELTIKTAVVGTSIVFNIQDCDTESGSYVSIATTKAYTAAQLTSGTLVKIPLPDEHRRFVQMSFVSTDITVGSADAFLQP